MTDACGKVNSGYLEGNLISYGDFQQCKHLRGAGVVYAYQPLNVTTLAILANNPSFLALAAEGTSPLIALCMPEACVKWNGGVTFVSTLVKVLGSPVDIHNLLASSDLFLSLPPIVEPYTQNMDWRAVCTVVFLALLVVLALAGAAVSLGGVPGCFELKIRADPAVKWLKYLECFSLTDNLWSLCDTTQRFAQTSALEGARVLSMQWVVIGHLYLMIRYTVSNVLFVEKEMKRWTFVTIENATVSVDSFFSISGFLLALVTLRKLRGRPSLRPLARCKQMIMFIVHRWLRLTPGLAVVMLVVARLVPYVSDSPKWSQVMGSNADYCNKHWWANLLYVNNFVPRNLAEECVAQSWYLANDFQFFIFTMPILMSFRDYAPFRNSLGLRCSVLLVPIVASCICRLVLADVYDFVVVNGGYEMTAKANRLNSDMYIQPHYRYATYGIGVLAGVLVDHWNHARVEGEDEATAAAEGGEYHMLSETAEEDSKLARKPEVRLNCLLTPRLIKWFVGFLVSLGMLGFIVLCEYGPYNGHPWTKTQNVLYEGFNRAAWSTFFMVILVGCAMGGLPLINKMLSVPIFIPLSKLSYGVYLIHLTYIETEYYQKPDAEAYFDNSIVGAYFSTLGIAYFLSALLFVLVDLPVAKLETHLLGRE
eukprot:gene6531-7826_t